MHRRDSLIAIALAAAAPMVLSGTARAQAATTSSTTKSAKAKDCVALVTGANRGIGLGFVNVLLERGAVLQREALQLAVLDLASDRQRLAV